MIWISAGWEQKSTSTCPEDGVCRYDDTSVSIMQLCNEPGINISSSYIFFLFCANHNLQLDASATSMSFVPLKLLSFWNCCPVRVSVGQFYSTLICVCVFVLFRKLDLYLLSNYSYNPHHCTGYIRFFFFFFKQKILFQWLISKS